MSSNLYTAAVDVEDLPLVRDLPPRPPVLRLLELTCIHTHTKHVNVKTQLPQSLTSHSSTACFVLLEYYGTNMKAEVLVCLFKL